MRTMRWQSLGGLLTVSVGLLAGTMCAPVSAVPLPAGGTFPGTPNAVSGSFTQLATTGVQTFDIDGTLGQVIEDVGVGFAPNPFGPTALSFFYQFNLLVDDPLTAITGSGFGGFFPVDVAIDPASGLFGPGLLPSAFPMSVDNLVPGTVSFNFNPVIFGASPVLIVNTSATTFTTGEIGVKGTTFTGQPFSQSFHGFAPTAAIPEPATLALIGLGLAGLAGSRRRKMN